MDPEKIRQILRLLDSDQAGEQAAALAKLRALKTGGQAVIAEVLEHFEKVGEVAAERDRLKQENRTLASQAVSLWTRIKLRAQGVVAASLIVGAAAAGVHEFDMEARAGEWAAERQTLAALEHRLELADRNRALAQRHHASPPRRLHKER
jgi:hypothetical protein